MVTVEEVDITLLPATSMASQILSKHMLTSDVRFYTYELHYCTYISDSYCRHRTGELKSSLKRE